MHKLIGTAARLTVAAFTLIAMTHVTWAAFSTPIPVSPRTQNAAWPVVAVDGSGNSIIVWLTGTLDESRVQMRTRSAAGVLGPVRILSALGQQHRPAVAMTATGNALVAWVLEPNGQLPKIQVRSISSTGVVGPVETLRANTDLGDAMALQLGMDSAGNALVLWRAYASFEARTRSVTGALGPIETVYGHRASGVQMAVDPAGNAIIAFETFVQGPPTSFPDPPCCLRVAAISRKASDRSIGPVRVLSPVGQANLSGVAAGPGGQNLVVWVREDLQGIPRIEGRSYSSGPVPQPPLALFRGSSSNLFDLSDADVAIDAEGDAVVTWYRQDYVGGGGRRVETRVRGSNGVLSPLQYVSNFSFRLEPPHIACAPGGNCVIEWTRFGDSDISRPVVETRTRSNNGLLGPLQKLFRHDTAGGQIREDAISVGVNGHAILGWVEATTFTAPDTAGVAISVGP